MLQRKEIKSRKRGEEDNLCVSFAHMGTRTSSSPANYIIILYEHAGCGFVVDWCVCIRGLVGLSFDILNQLY